MRGLLLLMLCGIVVGCKKKPEVVVGPEEVEPATTAPENAALTKRLTLLKSQSVSNRQEAVAIFSTLDSATAIPALLEALKDKGVSKPSAKYDAPHSTREAAVLALQRMGLPGSDALAKSGVPVLVAGLKDADPYLRERTVMALGLVGPKAKPATGALFDLATDSTAKVREQVYVSLARIGSLPTLETIMLLAHPDPGVVSSAATALPEVNDVPVEAIPPLIAALTSKDTPDYVRDRAAEMLGKLGPKAEKAVPALADLVRKMTEEEFMKSFVPMGLDAKRQRRRIYPESPAMTALRKIGKPAVPELAILLSGKDSFAKYQTAIILGNIGPDAIEALPELEKIAADTKSADLLAAAIYAIHAMNATKPETVIRFKELLKDGTPETKYLAASILGVLGPKAAPATPELLDLLDSPEEAHREAAIRALSKIGAEANGAVEKLQPKLNDADEDIRRQAAIALGAFGPVAGPAAAELAKHVMDSEKLVRKSAIEALKLIGPEGAGAVPVLGGMLADDKAPKDAILEVLTAIGPASKSVLPAIVKQLESTDVDVRRSAVNAIAAIGPEAASATGTLTPKLKDPSMRTRVIRALAKIGPGAKAAAGDLKTIAGKDPLVSIRTAAASAAMGVDVTANRDLLAASLKNKMQPQVRSVALESVEYLGAKAGPDVIAELKGLLSDKVISGNDSVSIREKAAIAIATLGPAGKPLVPALVDALKEKDEAFRLAVIETLTKLGPDAIFAAPKLRELGRSDPGPVGEAAERAALRIEPPANP